MMADYTSKVPKNIVYARFLRIKPNSIIKIRSNVYALPNCNENGELIKKYVIIELKYVDDKVSYDCSCEEVDCLHVQQIPLHRVPDCSESDFNSEFKYEYLTNNLISVYCQKDKSYGILSYTKC